VSKADSLQYLQESGYNTPPFVVLKQFGDFTAVTSVLPKNGHFAVRSSANLEDSLKFSFAGIFETCLNIPHQLLHEYIPKVFDFSKNDKLRSYLEYFGLDVSLLRMEVLVQEMKNCEKAGVAFFQNPSHKMPKIHIEAVWGLGEQCVSGKSFCDRIEIIGNEIVSYEADFQDKMSVCDKNVGLVIKNVELLKQSKRKLSTKEVNAISDVMDRISKDLSFDFQIEWGFYAGCLFLFQLRPITTLDKAVTEYHL